MMKNTAATLLMTVLSLVAACAPATPTPTRTPEATATPVEVLATKPEHLEGTWLIRYAGPSGRLYYMRWDADGTMWCRQDRGQMQEDYEVCGRFWFEDGVYYEDSDACFVTGSYRAYLTIEGGQAVELRFEEVDDSDLSCRLRLSLRVCTWSRVD
jgi:hypothetical protein